MGCSDDVMHKLTPIAGIYLGMMLVTPPCGADGMMSPRSQVTRAGARHSIEMTRDDLLGAKNWKSTQVRVLGFYLGMTRSHAIVNARRNGLSLLTSDLRNLAACEGSDCEVCYPRGICPGIALRFGHDGRVTNLQLTRVPDDAAAVVRRSAITLEFKGSTYQFFNNYSEALRLRLLGPGIVVKSQVQSSPKVSLMDVIYNYPERGIVIYALIDESSPQTPIDVDLAVSLVPPTPASPQLTHPARPPQPAAPPATAAKRTPTNFFCLRFLDGNVFDAAQTFSHH